MYLADDGSARVKRLLDETRALNERMRQQVRDGRVLLDQWRRSQEPVHHEAPGGVD
jgi:hypothetical protein